MTQSETMYSKGHYINGSWVMGTGSPFESVNPANSSVFWKGTNASKTEITMACNAAHNQLHSWSLLDFEARAHYMQLFAKQIEKHSHTLARCISMETGKPLWESYTEIKSVIAKIDISIAAYKERTWPKETRILEGYTSLQFKPQGVVVVLGAFNFPAHLSNGHIVPALLAGNTVLYKPSELAPGVAECIMQCWHDSGIPAGAINCLQGHADCGSNLLSQDIQGVYFTGSYNTGLKIHQQFANRPEVILALEMGGNNPLVVDSITNVKAGVYHTILSTLITSGQRCTCARRIIIPDTAVGDDFLTAFIKACTTIKIDAFDSNPEPFMGPVISHNQALKLLDIQKSLLSSGGRSLLSMELLQKLTGFVSPGLIDMTLVKNPPDEEFFGPLIQIFRYRDFDEAIQIANHTQYGLSAGLLSDSQTHYDRFYQGIRAGLINWNRPTTGASSNLAFGGIGKSGNHRASAFFAADYCAYPVSCMKSDHLEIPEPLMPGISC